jgi:flavin reductase (DIM6/NTAB) family NADH-FMN oxidoreductase RutF
MARARVGTSDYARALERQLRAAGISPADLAERAGLSPSHVYQLLRGDRADPRATTVRKIARALGEAEPDPGAGLAAGPAVDKATFFALMSAFPSGVTIVTTVDDAGQPRGLTCTAVCSLSADPPLVLACLDRRSHTLDAVRHSGRFVVNYLLAGRGDLANRFATTDPDKFSSVAWRPTAHGVPWLFADSLACAECALVQEVAGGDHVIVVGRVEGGHVPPPGTQPLIYFRRSYLTWRGA